MKRKVKDKRDLTGDTDKESIRISNIWKTKVKGKYKDCRVDIYIYREKGEAMKKKTDDSLKNGTLLHNKRR
jgi:hypothetical protein